MRAGWRAHVLDLCADADTAHTARSLEQVGDLASGFDASCVSQCLAELYDHSVIDGLVPGTGFEARPDLLKRIAAGRTLYGNPPALVRQMKSPRHFFALLERLGIPYPETVLSPPGQAGGWLVKRTGGAGGAHVRHYYAADRHAPDDYFQRHVEGQGCSVVFLADGREARTLGFNETWVATPGFRYGGAVALPAIDPELKAALSEAVTRLVSATGLRGLNGLDFIVAGDGWYALELNPRPPASFELHEHGEGLFAAHVAACRGRLPSRDTVARTLRGHALVYAEHDLRIQPRTAWPEWVSDRPCAGTAIAKGLPVCSVHAEAEDPATTRGLLSSRSSELRALLGMQDDAG
ncbi:MAG: ATP-grasp domain-containing protein [Gammaproteobacteria bacterium]